MFGYICTLFLLLGLLQRYLLFRNWIAFVSSAIIYLINFHSFFLSSFYSVSSSLHSDWDWASSIISLPLVLFQHCFISLFLCLWHFSHSPALPAQTVSLGSVRHNFWEPDPTFHSIFPNLSFLPCHNITGSLSPFLSFFSLLYLLTELCSWLSQPELSPLKVSSSPLLSKTSISLLSLEGSAFRKYPCLYVSVSLH